jgi:4-amino-4-deoxychorismate lyase
MSQSHGSFNGQLIIGNSQTQTVDLIADRGLAYGHGLFETILFQNSQIPLLERHLSRLNRDANTLGIPVKSSLVQTYLNQFVDHLKSENINNGVIKIVVTAGVGGRGYQSPQPIEPSIICSYASLPAYMNSHKRDGIAVRYCQHRLPNQPALAGIKHLNRLDQVLARREWDCADYQDGLMFTHTDQLIEAISANVFLKNATGDWLTPCLQGAGVSGVMRSVLLEEIFPACQIAVQVRAIEMDELAECQQLFVCNSVRGLIAVTEIYNSQNKLLRSLLADRQTLMLSEKLTEMYPCF